MSEETATKANKVDDLKNKLADMKVTKPAKPKRAVLLGKKTVTAKGKPSKKSGKKGKYSPEMKDALWNMAKKDGITAEVLAALAKKYPDARGLDRGKANSIVQARKNKLNGGKRSAKRVTVRTTKGGRKIRKVKTVTWVHPGGDSRKPTTFKRWGDGKVLVVVGEFQFRVSEDKAKSILSDLI